MKSFLTGFSCCVLVALVFVGIVPAQTSPDAEIIKLTDVLSKAYVAGNYAEALPAATRLVELARQKFGEKDIAVARALKNRGFVENSLGDGNKAEKTLEEAMSIFSAQADMSKTDGKTFASLLETLAVLKMKAKMSSGTSYLELAVKWRERSNGPDATELAIPLAALANLRFWNHEYQSAAEMYKRALLIMSKTVTDRWDDNISTVFSRAECSYRKAKMGDQFGAVSTQYRELLQARGLPETGPRVISAGVINGKAKYLPVPPFPSAAKVAGASGSVVVQVLINEKGEVLSACSVSGNPYLTESSENAAYGAKFAPTTLQGKPVKVSGVITYNYNLGTRP